MNVKKETVSSRIQVRKILLLNKIDTACAVFNNWKNTCLKIQEKENECLMNVTYQKTDIPF